MWSAILNLLQGFGTLAVMEDDDLKQMGSVVQRVHTIAEVSGVLENLEQTGIFNIRCACTAKVTVLVLCVCLSV